jgi:hypothetical protein
MLQLRGCGQEVIGVVGGIGLKMLQHHSEQVVARQALYYLGRVWCYGSRVAVVHDQRVDPGAKIRAAFLHQPIANGGHVDAAAWAIAQQVRTLQRGALHREGA